MTNEIIFIDDIGTNGITEELLRAISSQTNFCNILIEDIIEGRVNEQIINVIKEVKEVLDTSSKQKQYCYFLAFVLIIKIVILFLIIKIIKKNQTPWGFL